MTTKLAQAVEWLRDQDKGEWDTAMIASQGSYGPEDYEKVLAILNAVVSGEMVVKGVGQVEGYVMGLRDGMKALEDTLQDVRKALGQEDAK